MAVAALNCGGRMTAGERGQSLDLGRQALRLTARVVPLGAHPDELRLEDTDPPLGLCVPLGETPGDPIAVLPLPLSVRLGHLDRPPSRHVTKPRQAPNVT